MPDSQPDTKTCLECSSDSPVDAVTCGACGGGSFPTAVALQDAYAAECAAEAAKLPTEAQLRQRRAQALTNERIAGDREPADQAEADAWWAKGWRPDNMCAACPGPMQPCKDCFVRAGYPAAAYDQRFGAPPSRVVAPADVAPAAIITEIPPVLQPPDVAPPPTDDAIPPPANVPVIGETAAFNAPPDDGAVPVDMPSGPLSHDGDEPESPATKPESPAPPADETKPARRRGGGK